MAGNTNRQIVGILIIGDAQDIQKLQELLAGETAPAKTMMITRREEALSEMMDISALLADLQILKSQPPSTNHAPKSNFFKQRRISNLTGIHRPRPLYQAKRGRR